MRSLGLLVVVACTGGDVTLTDDEREALDELAPDVLPGPPADVSNRFADRADAADLGRELFFDPGFSGPLWHGDNNLPNSGALGRVGEAGKVSCAGCHSPSAAFADDRSLGNLEHSVSLGASWTVRRSPSLQGVAHAPLVMWDGSRDSLWAQVFGPLENKLEMNSSRLFMAQQIFARYRDRYEAVFGPMPPLDDTRRFSALSADRTGCRKLGATETAFECHGMPGDGAEYDGMASEDRDEVTRVVVNAGKAIAAYERTLACGPSRFDAWMHGDTDALTDTEKRGAVLFVGKADCVRCHGGPMLSDQTFHNVGLKAEPVAVIVLDANDPGAAVGLAQLQSDPLNTRSAWSDGDPAVIPASIAPEMLGAFKTPSLRCVSQRPSFMHTGQMQTLEEVVEFFAKGGDRVGFVGVNELAPIDLTDEERADLVAFLHALDSHGSPP
jgi:cytochrome c peroxidase